MGVERSVSRWYARRQLILEDLLALEATLASVTGAPEGEKEPDNVVNSKMQLQEVQERLRALGPCPKSMMG